MYHSNLARYHSFKAVLAPARTSTNQGRVLPLPAQKRAYSAPNQFWFSKGLPFKCTGCGKCCTGEGVVNINKKVSCVGCRCTDFSGCPADVRLSGYHCAVRFGEVCVNVPRDFMTTYTRRDIYDGTWILKDREEQNEGEDNDTEPACIFLENNKCKVYPVRPHQCLSYPFWPGDSDDVLAGKKLRGVLESKKEWDAEEFRCEGINHPDAQLTPEHVILRNVRESIKDFKDCLTFARTNVDKWAKEVDAERETTKKEIPETRSNNNNAD